MKTGSYYSPRLVKNSPLFEVLVSIFNHGNGQGFSSADRFWVKSEIIKVIVSSGDGRTKFFLKQSVKDSDSEIAAIADSALDDLGGI